MDTAVERTKTAIDVQSLTPESRPLHQRVMHLWRRYDLALVGGLFFTFILVVSLLAPVFAPYDPAQRDIKNRLAQPTIAHPFGTDEIGRDVLSRVIYGGRTVLSAGFAALGVSFAVGLLIGIVSGYYGGWVDNLLMRLMDILLSFPSVLLAILIVTTLGTGQTNLIIAIGVAHIPVFARLVRAIVLILIRQDYVLAARSLGAGDSTIILQHIFPNMIPPILVQATAMLAITIASATALNFLGLGVETGTPDWGMMVADGQALVFDAPHIPFFPGLCLLVTVLSVNFIGDGLRDHLDPRLRNQTG
jgi:peptide/nickel transport system permease protein